MNFKLLLRTLLFLAILFVMLYVGMNNTQAVDFYFPIASPKPIHETAALLYFAIFAIGIVGGTLLGAGGGGKSSGKGSSSSRDK